MKNVKIDNSAAIKSATAAIREKLPFDSARSIVPVASVAKTPLVLVVHPSLPAKSVKELVALAKANPGKLNYSSAGTGGNNHFAASLFSMAAGIRAGGAQTRTRAPSDVRHRMFDRATRLCRRSPQITTVSP